MLLLPLSLSLLLSLQLRLSLTLSLILSLPFPVRSAFRNETPSAALDSARPGSYSPGS